MQLCYEQFIATLFRYICSNFPMLNAQAVNTLNIDWPQEDEE